MDAATVTKVEHGPQPGPVRGLRLVVFTANPLEAYVRKGTIRRFNRDINPTGLFNSVTTVYVSDDGPSGEYVVHGIHAMRIRHWSLPLDMLRLVVAGVRAVLQTRACVVRAYCAELPGLAAVLTGRLTGRRSVVSVHADIQSIMRQRGYSRVARLLVGLLHRVVYRLSTQVWCVSEWLAQHLVQLGVPARKIRVTYNKVDTARFRRTTQGRDEVRHALGIPPRALALVHVGRLSQEKHIDVLIRGLAALRQQGHSAHLILVGTGLDSRGQSYVRGLQGLMGRLGLGAYVHFIGGQPNERVPDILHAADVYVSASISEGFGVALVEAQAAGVPLVVTCELAEEGHGLVLTGENALTYPAGSPTGLAECVLRLTRNPDLIQRLREAGVMNAARFDWETVAKREAALYREVCGTGAM